MKKAALILFLMLGYFSHAQQRQSGFFSANWNEPVITDPSPSALAAKLTKPYTTDLQKVRSIFRWITENISYRTYSRYNVSARYHLSVWDDTLTEWGTGEEMIARKVLQNGVAFCDGYAKLFKALCNYAGIRSEVVVGYARTSNTKKFISNHSWNAVFIDSAWHLLDATWASGYISYRTEEFVKAYDDFYFLTPPAQFIKDHYPEDARWTLLDNAPVLKEFERSPFKHSNFIKYSISSYYPAKGVIEASVGDTVEFSLTSFNFERDKRVASNPFFDSAILFASPGEVFLNPEKKDRKIVYRYIINSKAVQWLYIIYNGDIVLRYRLNIKGTLL